MLCRRPFGVRCWLVVCVRPSCRIVWNFVIRSSDLLFRFYWPFDLRLYVPRVTANHICSFPANPYTTIGHPFVLHTHFPLSWFVTTLLYWRRSALILQLPLLYDSKVSGSTFTRPPFVTLRSSSLLLRRLRHLLFTMCSRFSWYLPWMKSLSLIIAAVESQISLVHGDAIWPLMSMDQLTPSHTS
jgi:hypothetical protein